MVGYRRIYKIGLVLFYLYLTGLRALQKPRNADLARGRRGSAARR